MSSAKANTKPSIGKSSIPTMAFARAFISIMLFSSPAASMRLMLGMNASTTELRKRFTTWPRIAAIENAAKLCSVKSDAATHWSAWPRSTYAALETPKGAV